MFETITLMTLLQNLICEIGRQFIGLQILPGSCEPVAAWSYSITALIKYSWQYLSIYHVCEHVLNYGSTFHHCINIAEDVYRKLPLSNEGLSCLCYRHCLGPVSLFKLSITFSFENYYVTCDCSQSLRTWDLIEQDITLYMMNKRSKVCHD